jgi:hypothetical protein
MHNWDLVNNSERFVLCLLLRLVGLLYDVVQSFSDRLNRRFRRNFNHVFRIWNLRNSLISPLLLARNLLLRKEYIVSIERSSLVLVLRDLACGHADVWYRTHVVSDILLGQNLLLFNDIVDLRGQISKHSSNSVYQRCKQGSLVDYF